MATRPLRILLLAAAASMAAASGQAQVIAAENDKTAIFDGKSFLLPDSGGEKDVYLIVLNYGKEERRLQLPAGATALRITSSAVPKVAWKWRYVLTKAQLPPLDVVQPTRERLTYVEVSRYDDAILLAWKADAKADRYRVTISADKASSLSAAPEWGKEETEELADDALDPACGCVHYAKNAKPGDRFRWKGTALAADGTPLSETAFRVVTVEEPWSKELSGKGLKLQRSDTLAKDAAGKPALFGYQSNQKEGGVRGSAYLTQFAVVWSPTDVSSRVLYPRASLEAKLTSSGTDKTNDALRLRAGGYAVIENVPFNFTTNLKYDTERKSGTKKGSLELIAAPTFAPFSRYYPAPSASNSDAAGNFATLPWVRVMPTLLLGAEAGRTFDVGSSVETRRNFSRARADLRLDAELNFLASALRLPAVSLFGESTYWRLASQGADELTYSVVGASFKITKDVSLEFAYSVGRDAPTFNFTRAGSVGLGIQIK